ncbi:uncharacterized protein DDB_G0286299-like [Mercenaria mercenaria]|uniref:uncharacterized protein DDB_G0286299-like n=1 Tax=Mercenaria mercenaria TaxID=6596 RepID=UPI00234EE210|nr:uncharacterized protein DDB_G0286299-like [Mercenaria mercenaria]
MGKTRAEYQKEYRERKKLQDKDFLKRERQRTKQYKLPINALDKDKQNELREKNRLWKRQSRERKKNKIQQEKDREREENTQNCETQTNSHEEHYSERTTRNKSSQSMMVKMSFEPRKRSQKRSKALRKASRTIETLEEKMSKLTRENKKLRKRHERATKANQKAVKSTPTQNEQTASTPKSKANREIRELGLTPRKVPTKIKRKFIMANAMIAEVQSTRRRIKPKRKEELLPI